MILSSNFIVVAVSLFDNFDKFIRYFGSKYDDCDDEFAKLPSLFWFDSFLVTMNNEFRRENKKKEKKRKNNKQHHYFGQKKIS